MVNFIVTGNCKRVVTAVLLAIRSFTDAKCVVVGGAATGVLRWSGLCKRQVTVNIDGGDDAGYVDAVRRVAAQNPQAILIPADCDAVRLVNRVRGRLGVRTSPIPDLPTLNMFDNKWLFHQFCSEQRLPVPATRYFGGKAEMDFGAIVGELGLPFVVKPLNCAGSTGVHIVRSEADFRSSILENAGYDYGALIAQRFIPGADVDISFLAVNGRLSACAVQQASGSQIHFLAHPALQALAAELAAASLYHGVMHVDARVEEGSGKLYLIESNPRFWASLTASVWCGLNFVAESLLPAPKNSGVRALTAGSASMRHPLIRPAAWRGLLTDRSSRGRLLRAMAFDPPALGGFARELPATVLRAAQRPLPGGSRRAANAGELAEEIA
ncbi:MAG TPA: ATP-grasp domain-containing protein [Noviherbaspirillum sp.]|uniref:ATP-grasp domain-containing protein n=1 Tax=Noviherbaspirillum sp. TaxID=1926288 RepID=UPI002D3BA6DE|nr:ATP-grasp domain-containing protein [Noviherbaspirillum sp.]HYD94807.1 ATP-grasp domain-containing protein [Noviherbaspirillum sp.]